jgi:hypothetical protein
VHWLDGRWGVKGRGCWRLRLRLRLLIGDEEVRSQTDRVEEVWGCVQAVGAGEQIVVQELPEVCRAVGAIDETHCCRGHRCGHRLRGKLHTAASDEPLPERMWRDMTGRG